LRDEPIALIRGRQADLESILINPYLKRRIRERTITNYLRVERQSPPYSFDIALILILGELEQLKI